jgi:ectoine hydroxylase-related dioxygenase (phytanoyl-CoA dioxygenase family)
MALSKSEIAQFWQDGFLVVPDAITPVQLAAMRGQIDDWVEESRGHREPFGPPTLDGRPRFDMGEEHRSDRPALRRVNNPSDVAPAFRDVMEKARVVDMVADLLGPDVKFHHCKINLKLPGSNTEVGYHQDFAYTPHTNDDLITALIFIDEVTEDNGALMVVPGSHKGPLHSLFENGRFTGSIEDGKAAEMKAQQVPAIGPAGSVCLMHTRLCHGSEANRSDRPRALYICVYSAADAFPLARNPMANPNEGMIVRGKATRFARLMEGPIELPQQPKSASFFAVQGQKSAGKAAE